MAGCQCTGFQGRPCARPGSGKGGRCPKHGGLSPGGAAGSRTKTGTFSRYLAGMDGQVLKDFRTAHGDPKLMALRDEAALLDTQIQALKRKLPDGRPAHAKLAAELRHTLDLKRRIVEAEARRERDLNLMVPYAQFQMALFAMAMLIRELCGDDADKLRTYQRKMEVVLLPARAGLPDGGKAGG